MFKLRFGYLFSGTIIGLILLGSIISTLPDGKLHIIHCSVGQGDAAYIKFPDGRDMIVDGGPNKQIIDCLSRHMPIWDRQLDIVLMTHPQKDHLQGLIELLKRYEVGSFIKSEVGNTSDGYEELVKEIKTKNIPVKFLTRDSQIKITDSQLSFLWPADELIAKAKNSARPGLAGRVSSQGQALQSDILGVSTDPPGDLNDYSLVFHLRYGNFDALFTGDADTRVESDYLGGQLGDGNLELLKVPHHGSKTGLSQKYLDWLYPDSKNTDRKQCDFSNVTPLRPTSPKASRDYAGQAIQQPARVATQSVAGGLNNCPLAVISVGKNSYGHPADNIIQILKDRDIQILRTDETGDIEVVSDGVSWLVQIHNLK